MNTPLVVSLWFVAYCFFSPNIASGQDSTVFTVKRTVINNLIKADIDTFIQRTFVSTNTEKRNRIIYRTGFRLVNEHNLIFFHATQSVIDTMKVLEDKNASLGDFQKLPYFVRNDSIIFVIERTVPSRTIMGRDIKIKNTYTGSVNTANPTLEVLTTSDLPAEAPNRLWYDSFILHHTSLLIRKKPAP